MHVVSEVCPCGRQALILTIGGVVLITGASALTYDSLHAVTLVMCARIGGVICSSAWLAIQLPDCACMCHVSATLQPLGCRVYWARPQALDYWCFMKITAAIFLALHVGSICVMKCKASVGC